MTDPVSVWLEQNTVAGATAWVPKSALIAAYNKAAEESGRAGLMAQSFGRAIKRARPDVGEAQRVVGGQQVKCYTGIGLKGGDDPEGGGGTTATTDFTICSGFGETLHKQDEREDSGTQKKQAREIGSNGSNHSRRRLTDEQAERVKRSIDQGMSPKRARQEVLGEDAI